MRHVVRLRRILGGELQLERAREPDIRWFYVEQSLALGWSRNVLMLHMDRGLHARQVLRDDGLSYQDYLEQLTFLLFLKMADERARLTGKEQPIPKG